VFCLIVPAIGKVGSVYQQHAITPECDCKERSYLERLAKYKIPKSIRFMQDFPRTPAGKVRKHLLHDALG
jgi:non-ribosomal peptide synthetase component E (peptide arylation enzyme)